MIPGPPYFVGLRQELWRLDFGVPSMLREQRPQAPLAEFPGGVRLVSLEFETAEAYTGELVEFRARWHLDAPLSGALCGLEMEPAHAPGAVASSPREFRPYGLREKGLFVQGFPVLHCLYGLPASPPGTVYEQSGRIMIPSNAPTGGYVVRIGFAESYPPKYTHWTDLGDDHVLRVRGRPLPTN